MSGNKVILNIKPKNKINMEVLPPSLSLTDVERAENAANVAMAWAQDAESPDGENDTDSPTGKTQSSKSWALNAKNDASSAAASASAAATSETNAITAAAQAELAKQQTEQIAGSLGNPVTDVDEDNGTVTVTKSDGTQNTFGVVKSVNGVTPTGGNVDITGVPTGTILPFAGNTVPEGFLACNGAGISASTYSALYAVIGNTYGGDSTTFNLPNAESDKFLQGNSTPGTVKPAGLPNIIGDLTVLRYNDKGTQTGAFKEKIFYKNSALNSGSACGRVDINFDASLSNSIYGNSETVQPPAVTVRYIIKY